MPGHADSPVHLEAEYNVRLLHADRAEYHSRGLRESQETYATLPCRRGLRYGPGERALIDFFPPTQPAPGGLAPVVAFFHGGYWAAHRPDEYAFVARTLARSGIATALVGYDLAPAARMDGIVAQARGACRWLRAQAAELGFDEHLVFTAGHSAGAHLAASVLTDPKVHEARGAFLVSGIYDLRPLRSTSINEPLHLTEAGAKRLSPVFQAEAAEGDLLVAVGAFETTEFLRQSRELADRWRSDSRAAELLVVPAVHHYSIVLELARPDSALSRAAVQRVLRSSARYARRNRPRRR